MDNITRITLAKLLSTFFYYPPNNKVTTPLIQALLHIDDLVKWLNPCIISEQCNILANHIDDSELNYQFSLLFEGQGTMPAPPWGSFYLDKEHLLLGESQECYRQFLQQHGLILNTGMNEPEDQFGLMLMAYAMLLENNNYTAAKQLINEHLLIWSSTYLKRLKQNEISPFYRALAMIADQYLQML
ncbi:MAG: molecular chaperone [Gilliamella sp.]|uniref:TorD/DmsD family molecular chaperone n=1 Tax=Gilliamella sp. TaxID=1891236 RepID=UPI0025CCEC38|nr:molecular chaperone [Gilliamella sp.]MCO6549741.1 molecular chaperone [Gilliamella sp.]